MLKSTLNDLYVTLGSFVSRKKTQYTAPHPLLWSLQPLGKWVQALPIWNTKRLCRPAATTVMAIELPFWSEMWPYNFPMDWDRFRVLLLLVKFYVLWAFVHCEIYCSSCELLPLVSCCFFATCDFLCENRVSFCQFWAFATCELLFLCDTFVFVLVFWGAALFYAEGGSFCHYLRQSREFLSYEVLPTVSFCRVRFSRYTSKQNTEKNKERHWTRKRKKERDT